MADATSAPAAAPGAPKRNNPSLRERVSALRNLPPFLREIWATSRTLTLTSLCLRLLRALLPIITLYIGKLIIDEAVRLVAAGVRFDSLQAAWNGGELDHLLLLLASEFALAIASDLLGRLVSYA
jgi:ATP-binding cassette subfamily B protein